LFEIVKQGKFASHDDVELARVATVADVTGAHRGRSALRRDPLAKRQQLAQSLAALQIVAHPFNMQSP
jgi:hypothetical protein